jgi:hypothetical protein
MELFHILLGNIVVMFLIAMLFPSPRAAAIILSFFRVRHVADFENQTMFLPQNTPNSWICYDFKDMRVTLTHYSVRSRRDYNGYHLRSWMLKGSIDCESWVEIDHHTNDSSLKSKGAIATFPISTSSDYQYIRLRQIDVNSNGNHYLMVNAIEFYGTLTILKQ